jgi:hypothetical protein
MTAVVAQTSATGRTPVAEGLARIHASIDELGATDTGEVSGRDVAEVDRAMSRLAAAKLSMVAAAHRQGAAERAGMTSTGTWLAAHTRAGGAQAAADVALATALDASLPLTREALAVGALSTEHAAVIAGTTSRLPESLTDAERSKVEAALVARARLVDPARLRRSARRALEAAERTAEEALVHEDAELRGEEDRARRRTRLTLHDNLDGTVTGHFTVPTLAGAILRKTIQQMVSPRRHQARAAVRDHDGPLRGGPGHDGPVGGGPGHDGPLRGGVPGAAPTSALGSAGHHGGRSALRDWSHEYGKAFVELLEHLPTDRLSGKAAATVVVTIDHDRLRDQLGAAHLDTGHDLSAAETRRLACSAGVLPAILDGSSLPLDLGRTKRFYTESQRVALATTYDRCAAEHCDRPYAWTDLHHEDPWAGGGRTDLHLAVPLCGPDHRRAHDARYEHTITTDATGRKTLAFHLRQ